MFVALAFALPALIPLPALPCSPPLPPAFAPLPLLFYTQHLPHPYPTFVTLPSCPLTLVALYPFALPLCSNVFHVCVMYVGPCCLVTPLPCPAYIPLTSAQSVFCLPPHPCLYPLTPTPPPPLPCLPTQLLPPSLPCPLPFACPTFTCLPHCSYSIYHPPSNLYCCVTR